MSYTPLPDDPSDEFLSFLLILIIDRCLPAPPPTLLVLFSLVQVGCELRKGLHLLLAVVRGACDQARVLHVEGSVGQLSPQTGVGRVAGAKCGVDCIARGSRLATLVLAHLQ